jgi:hypothetical protein
MKEAYRTLDICTMQDGAVVERINAELMKVAQNVRDINTDAKAPREITLKLKLIPTEDRQSMGIVVSCASKLVSGEKLMGRVYFDDAGRPVEPKDVKPGNLFEEALEATEEEVVVATTKGKKLRAI